MDRGLILRGGRYIHGTVCGIVRYLPDGTAAHMIWVLDERGAKHLQQLLGEPDAQTMMSAEQVEAVTVAQGSLPVVWGSQHG